MDISNSVATLALGLSITRELSSFIKKKPEDIDLYYVAFSVFISSLWLFYHHTNGNNFNKMTTMFFLGINILLILRCLQARTGFLEFGTSHPK
jgi:hypothetical protein